MGTYEDEVEEVGEGVDHRDQEEGQQARDANLTKRIHDKVRARICGRNSRAIRLEETGRRGTKLTMSPDRSAAGCLMLALALLVYSSGSRSGVRVMALRCGWGNDKEDRRGGGPHSSLARLFQVEWAGCSILLGPIEKAH